MRSFSIRREKIEGDPSPQVFHGFCAGDKIDVVQEFDQPHAPQTEGSSSVNITVDEILNEGEYTVYATFKDEVNQVYGEASTNFTVSKIEDYQINIIAPSEAKIGDDVIITINFPIDATGNVTIQVNDDKQNLTIINGTASLTFTSLKEGTYSVIVNYEGDNKYDANENSTDFTVSKVETNNTDEVLNITTPIGTTTPTFSINLPADATGNLTVTH